MKDRLRIGPIPLDQALQPFLGGCASSEQKIAAVLAALNSPEGKFWREELGNWTVRMVPVELLVPEAHRDWRPLVRDSILFVVSKLSAARLAPKIIEQMRLAADTAPEMRLLRFIANVPGLQKIGQVLARNRNLDPRLRRALIQLENGISDVSAQEIRSIIKKQVRSQMETYSIRLDSAILSEASVSAVLGFTWHNPESGRRERGVFKVLKPRIPTCYAEDMRILGQLAQHLARKHRASRANLGRLADTLTEIQLLLEREVDFPREQATLAGALDEYRGLPGVRVPRVIPMLSTATITALGFEPGRKVTESKMLPPRLRLNVAERLAKTLLAVPALSRKRNSIFHADPHAGNLLYDKRRNELVILDWALTEQLTREQRRDVVLLILMMILRDADGICRAVENLCALSAAEDRPQLSIIRQHVDRLLDELPLTRLPGPMDAMRLLDEIVLEGVRFPAALLMFRKASFTLDGVVEDIAGSSIHLDSLVTSHAFANWTATAAGLLSLFSAGDWVALDWSALTFASRVFTRMLLRPWSWLPGFSPSADAA